jgi:hypothetical protein
VFNFTTIDNCDSIVTVTVLTHPAATFDLVAEQSCHNTATGSVEVLTPAGGTPPFEFSLYGSNNWQNTLEFNTLDPGSYTVLLRDAAGCLFADTAEVPEIAPLSVTLPNALIPCDSINGVLLTPALGGDQTGLTYTWSNGATTAGIRVLEPGTVSLQVQNQCEMVQQNAEVAWADAGDWSQVYVPNAFAPEAVEAQNAVFLPTLAPGLAITRYRLEVYDRWGNRVFETNNQSEGWHGPLRDKMLQDAVFVWWLEADLSFCGRNVTLRKKGDVTVVR